MTEPDKRDDGICARRGCGKPLVSGPPKTMPKNLRTTFVPELAVDPWCSATCAREAYGVKRADLPVMSTTPRKSVTVPPTRLQRARLELSDATRELVADGKRPSEGVCDLCGVAVDATDALGRELSSAVRRFCSVEHRRRFHQIYKKQAAA